MVSRRILWTSSFGCFVIYACVATSIGPVLSPLSKDFALTPSSLGITLGVQTLGGLMAILGGWISDKGSRLFVSATSMMLLGAASLVLAVSWNPLVVAASLFLMSMAASFIESSMNAFISNLYPERRGLSVNLFHIAWNVGSTIGPSLAAFLIVTTGNWRNAYLFPLPVLFSVSVLMVLFSRSVTHVPSAGARPRNPASVSLGLLVKFLPVAMIAFFYVAVEMGLSTWLAYILENLGSAALEAGLATGLFWGLMGVGRLVWAPIVDRTGYVKPLIAASGLALICMVSASLPLPLGLKMLLWASSGLFLAPMFPTLIAWVVSLAPELGGSLSGLVFTLATIGLFFSNSLVGMVAATFSVEIAQYVFVFFAVAMLVNILAVHLSERQGS